MACRKLVTLLDMKRIYVDKVTTLIDCLAALPHTLRGVDVLQKTAKVSSPLLAGEEYNLAVQWTNEDLDGEILAKAKPLVGFAVQQCADLDLRLSLRHAERLEHLVSKGKADLLKLSKVQDELKARIHDELESSLFLKVDADKDKYYDALQLFGDSVDSAFPSARYDIRESGSCFACGRWTASVFHLMRALETPLRLLAMQHNVKCEFGNWNKVLNQFDSKLKEILKENSAKKPLDWRENEQFYSEASALLRNVKNAWRNRVSHADESYDEERARGVLNSVESIMKHLSSILRETETAT